MLRRRPRHRLVVLALAAALAGLLSASAVAAELGDAGHYEGHVVGGLPGTQKIHFNYSPDSGVTDFRCGCGIHDRYAGVTRHGWFHVVDRAGHGDIWVHWREGNRVVGDGKVHVGGTTVTFGIRAHLTA